MSMNDICASGTDTCKFVYARKDHVCCECGKTIPKGQKYQYFKACWPQLGGWLSFKTCVRCSEIRDSVIDKYPPTYEDEGPAFGELWDYGDGIAKQIALEEFES